MDFISSPSARAANVGGPGLSFTRAFDVKGQPLAFPDVVRIDACGFQRADVQKHVRAAGIVSDEAIAALGVPHFQFSGSHPALFPPCLQPQLDQAADGFGAGDPCYLANIRVIFEKNSERITKSPRSARRPVVFHFLGKFENREKQGASIGVNREMSLPI